MAYNRRSGGYGGNNSGNFGNSYGQGGNNNFGGSGNYGSGAAGGNFNGGAGGRFNNFGNNYGRNPKMSPWESGVSPGGGMMPNVHPNQMALASDLLSKLLAPNQGGYGGGQNWGPNPGMMRRPDTFKNQNRRRPDNRNRRPPPKKDDKKKDSKPEADKNDQSAEANGDKKETADQEHVDYDGIPTAVLFCHVCQKHMWDGASFEKHVRGRPHELMMIYLDEGYKMQVELMRHHIKAAENQREIDLERMQAQNKGKAKPLFRNYCPMCNINFYGPLTGHRKSDRHRKLKQFLHPECKMCDMLFHTRLEWDDHKLSSDHLRKVGEQRRKFNPDLKDDEFELLDVIIIEEDEAIEEETPVAIKNEMLDDQKITEDTEEDVKEGEEIGDESVNIKEDEGDTEKVATDEIKEGDTVKEDADLVKKDKEEKYNPANVVGRELVVKTGGHVCRLCNMFMKNDEEAELHCQTATHFINFTSITKLHAKINNRKRKMKEEKKENGDGNIKVDETEIDTETAPAPEKQARLETEEVVKEVVAEQNGIEKPEAMETSVAEGGDGIEEIKTVEPISEEVEEVAKEAKEESNIVEAEVAKPEIVEPTPITPVKNSPPAKTPTRGRGARGGRGAYARRGRSSR